VQTVKTGVQLVNEGQNTKLFDSTNRGGADIKMGGAQSKSVQPHLFLEPELRS